MAALHRRSTGSSPRLRGTLISLLSVFFSLRFIPAPAGNTWHPKAQAYYSRGSSPRLRGTRLAASVEPYPTRFIPAPAGNTGSLSLRQSSMPVHPRACGEHRYPEESCDLFDGSSPRLRGTHWIRIDRIGNDRFIPAPAGNTVSNRWRAFTLPVHPRACGEHSVRSDTGSPQCGSSPRLRGTREPPGFEHHFCRFIPAPAGNTCSGRSMPRRISVHPRACGNTPVWTECS